MRSRQDFCANGHLQVLLGPRHVPRPLLRPQASRRSLHATSKEDDPEISGKIRVAQRVTVISWITYPVVYLFPELGFAGAEAVGAIQHAYGATDISSKIRVAQGVTVISWITYPVVYLFPELGFAGAEAVGAIQHAYGATDISSECGVGLVILNPGWPRDLGQIRKAQGGHCRFVAHLP